MTESVLLVLRLKVTAVPTAGLATSREPGRVMVVDVPGGRAHVPVGAFERPMVNTLGLAPEVPETVLQFVALLMVVLLTPTKEAPKMAVDGVMVMMSPAVRAKPEVYTMTRDVGVMVATLVLGAAESQASEGTAMVV